MKRKKTVLSKIYSKKAGPCLKAQFRAVEVIFFNEEISIFAKNHSNRHILSKTS
jgi:hypothetical protein